MDWIRIQIESRSQKIRSWSGSGINHPDPQHWLPELSARRQHQYCCSNQSLSLQSTVHQSSRCEAQRAGG